MKNSRQEALSKAQRQYHKNHPWRLSKSGLYVPHCYSDDSPGSQSYWDDVGFILNGRRVIVWWRHPRRVYEDEIDSRSWLEAGHGPDDNWLTEGLTKNYKKVGRSRKKIVSYLCRAPSAEQRAHYDLLGKIRDRMSTEGIDFSVAPSFRRERLNWATGVSLVAPIEVRNEIELANLASLARGLILGKTTLENEFPSYSYSRADWLQDAVEKENINKETPCRNES